MKQREQENQFSANLGLKQGHAITSMPAGSLLDVLNMNLNGKGGKETRQGYINLFAIPANDKIRSLFQYRSTGGINRVISFAGTKIYDWNGAAVSAIKTGLTAEAPWEFINYAGRCYGVNGFDSSFLYDGTTVTQIGISPPAAYPTLALQAGGTLPIGLNQYLDTFFDSNTGTESEPKSVLTPPGLTTNAGNRTIQLSAFSAPAAGEQVTDRRIYRRSPTELNFTRIATIAVGTATYTDNGVASTNVALEFDTGAPDTGNVKPPLSKIICEYLDRIFYVPESDPELIVWSRITKPASVSAANFFPFGRDGFRILRVEKHAGYLIIHKRNSVWRLDGDPNSGGVFRRISPIGTQDRKCSVSAEDYVFRLTPKGIYYFNPTQYNNQDLREVYIGGDVIEEERAIIWDSSRDFTVAFYRKNRSRMIYVMFPNSARFLTKVLVYDLASAINEDQETQQWVKYEVGTDIYSTADYEGDSEEFMIFGDGYGRVYKWDIGETDGIALEPSEVNGTSTGGNTPTTLNDTNQAWAVNSLVGMRIKIRAGVGANQISRITSNTATQMVFTPAFAIATNSTSVYTIGAIEAFGEEYWNSNQVQINWKRMRWIVPYIRQNGAFTINISLRRDFKSGLDDENTKSYTLITENADGLWGGIIWGIDTWSGDTSTLQRLRFTGKYHYYSIKYRNDKSAERFFWDGYGAVFQYLYDRGK